MEGEDNNGTLNIPGINAKDTELNSLSFNLLSQCMQNHMRTNRATHGVK